jgi:abhydrolase domain-containing protein 12
MGVLRKGFLFLVFTVSLYPVFVGLLTIPWLQRQCVLFPSLFSYPCLPHFVSPPVLNHPFLSAIHSILLWPNTCRSNSALYAHKIHSGFWHDVNKPESFGFAAHQVTPFNVSTPDNEVLYAWHILPLATVAAHREALAAADLLDQTLPIQLLKSDPEARVVVNCKLSHLTCSDAKKY